MRGRGRPGKRAGRGDHAGTVRERPQGFENGLYLGCPVLPESPHSNHAHVISVPLTCQSFRPSETPSRCHSALPSVPSPFPSFRPQLKCHTSSQVFPDTSLTRKKVNHGSPILLPQRTCSSHSPFSICNPICLIALRSAPQMT